jgi:serine O-acetyltransferase
MKRSICEEESQSVSVHKAELPGIIGDITRSCHPGNCLNHVDMSPLPSKAEVTEVVEAMRNVLFPGYFGHQVDAASLPYYLGVEVNRLFERLSVQTSRAIEHECRRLGTACTLCQERGGEEAIRFLRKVPRLRELLAKDVAAAYRGDPAAKSYDEIIFSYPGLLAVTVYRVAHELHLQGVPLLPRMMTEYAHGLTGIDIHPGAEIGESFFIDHGTGVVVGETCSIGNNVKLYQGVTLGALSFPVDEGGELVRGRKRHPTIEDGVTIYAGATILGGETVVGAGSVIGGNVWLTRSVPPGTKVILEPKHRWRNDGEEDAHPE